MQYRRLTFEFSQRRFCCWQVLCTYPQNNTPLQIKRGQLTLSLISTRTDYITTKLIPNEPTIKRLYRPSYLALWYPPRRPYLFRINASVGWRRRSRWGGLPVQFKSQVVWRPRISSRQGLVVSNRFLHTTVHFFHPNLSCSLFTALLFLLL